LQDMADQTRSLLSRIAVSGMPTTLIIVSLPLPVGLTSTSTVYASTPRIAALQVLASILKSTFD